MEKKVQPITEKHFGQLIALFKEFADFEKLPEKMTNSLEQMQDEKDFLNGFVIQDEDDTIIAFVTFYFAYYTSVGKSLYMDDLYVVEKHRGQGLGTLLVDEVISYAKEHKCNKLRWQVSAWNEPAIRFYEGMGVEIDKVEMNCDLILK